MLSNFELLDMGKTYKVKIDEVLFKNDIKQIKIKQNMNVIVNLQSNSQTAKGTHWTLFLKRGKDTLFWDSFGGITPPDIIQYSKAYVKGNNAYTIQDLKSDRCGSFCFALLHFLSRNKGKLFPLVNEFVNFFEDDTKKNDNILRDYFEKNDMVLK